MPDILYKYNQSTTIKTADFTAVSFDTYETSGTIVVTDPVTSVTNDTYSVLVVSGTATIGGTAYSPSRFPVVRYYNGSVWATQTAVITGGLTVDGREALTRDTQATTVVLAGDSMMAAADSYIEAAIRAAYPSRSFTFGYAAIGGESNYDVQRRLLGAILEYPIAGTDSPSAGTVVLRCEEPSVERLQDGAYSASWAEYAAAISPVTGVKFFDRGRFLGTARRQIYLARRSGNTLIMYPPATTNTSPYGVVANSGNEDAVMTGTALNSTLAQSEDAKVAGRYSGKATASASGAFGIKFGSFNGGYPQHVRGKVFIPIGSPITAISFFNSTGDTIGTILGNAATTKGAWTEIDFLWVPGGGDATTVSLGYSGSGDMTGAHFLFEHVYIREKWSAASGLTLVEGRRLRFQQIGSSTFPGGLSANRQYYVKSPSAGSTSLALTNGGSAITFSSAGFAYALGPWELSTTFTAEMASNFNITAMPISPWNRARTIIWSGHNPDEGGTTIQDLLELPTVDKSKTLVLQMSLASTSPRGTAAWHSNEWLTSVLEEEFPGQVVYARDALIAAGSGTGQDLLDAGNGICPSSLRENSDAIHINAAGSAVVATAVVAKFGDRRL